MTPKKLLSSIKIIVIALILAVGIQYIYAQTNIWISAPGAPTNCPTGYPGCDAPINVSSTTQDKLGSLTVNGSTVAQNPVGLYSWGQSVFDNTGGSAVSAIRIIDGNQNTGKVLTSDVNGNGTWQTPSTSGGGIVMESSPLLIASNVSDGNYPQNLSGIVPSGTTAVILSGTINGGNPTGQGVTITISAGESSCNTYVTNDTVGVVGGGVSGVSNIISSGTTIIPVNPSSPSFEYCVNTIGSTDSVKNRLYLLGYY